MPDLHTITGYAGPPVGTAIATQTRTFYDAALLSNLKALLRLAAYCVVRNIPPNTGQTVSWRRMEPLASVALTPINVPGLGPGEGQTPDPSLITVTEVTAGLFQFGDYVRFSDWHNLTGPDPWMAQTAMEQAYQIALTMDDVIQTGALGGTAVTYAGGVASRALVAAGADITELDLIVQNLGNAGVPKFTSVINPQTGSATVPGAPSYVGFTTPTGWRQLKRLKDASGNPVVDLAETYGSEASRLPGEVGKSDQIRFIETTNGFLAGGAGSGGADVNLSLILGQGALVRGSVSGNELRTFARPTDLSDSADPLGQRGHVGWRMPFATTILDDQRLERYEFADV